MPDQEYDDVAVAASIAAHAAQLAEAAGTSASPKAKYCRRIDDAAEIIARRSGAPFSSKSLHKSNVPRIVVGNWTLFADEDLQGFADERLNSAPVHHGPRRGMRASRSARQNVGGHGEVNNERADCNV